MASNIILWILIQDIDEILFVDAVDSGEVDAFSSVCVCIVGEEGHLPEDFAWLI